MAQNKPSCGECTDGEVSRFFVHHSEHRLRISYHSCPACVPGSVPSGAPQKGEEEVTAAEYYKLLEAEWPESDPV